jgi:hypothetical protein
MTGVIPTLRQGPATYQLLNAGAPITGGQLVIPDPSNLGGIIPATAGAVDVLGVAGLDAQVRTNQDGQNPVVLSQQSPYIPVYYGGVEIPVTYNGACDFGRLLIAGANGTVVPYTPPDIGLGGTIPNPSVPASGALQTNTYNDAVQVVVTGGTMTAVLINGVQEGTGAGTYQVPSGGTIELLYTVAPTWTWTLVPSGIAAPGVPASTTPVTNTSGYNVQVVITGGTMTAVIINGVIVGAGAGTYQLPAGAVISMTYSVAPTWTWQVQVSTFDMIVGRCTEPLGVDAVGTVARARIF